MPLYDYRCDSCHREFETVQLVATRSKATCPSCSCEAFLVIKKIPVFKLGQGRTLSGIMDWKRREKARLTKRSNDYDKTPRGKNARMESIVRQAKRGNF